MHSKYDKCPWIFRVCPIVLLFKNLDSKTEHIAGGLFRKREDDSSERFALQNSC